MRMAELTQNGKSCDGTPGFFNEYAESGLWN